MISDEAVEAAAKALHERDKSLLVPWGDVALPDIRAYTDEARAALEAAAPYLLPLGPHVTWSSEVTPANTAHIAHCPQCQEAFSRPAA